MSQNELMYGIHAVSSILQQMPASVRVLFLQDGQLKGRLEHLEASARKLGIKISRVSKQQLDQLTSQAVHQGVAAEIVQETAAIIASQDLESILNTPGITPLLLVLDGVQDPHNLGACLRTANAVGAHAVIAPKDRAVGITPVVRKVACGAAESTPFIQVTNLARTMELLKENGVWIYGTAEDATTSLYEADFTTPTAIVMGAEGAGMRRLTRENCDVLLRIPMQGDVPSLNVSVATGVCLFEVLRQRIG